MIANSLFPRAARLCYVVTEKHPTEPNLQNYEALHPLEKSLVSRAVPKRKAEFGDARWCAHTALCELGAPEAPILRGEGGMPLWPSGFTGSVTHTEGLRAAVVASRREVASLGIDAEPDEPLGEVLAAIARPGELERMDSLRASGVTNPDRLLFCAKEATYKAWYPLTHRWLGFEQAEIDVRADGTFFSYLLIRPTPVPFIEGRWQAREGYVVAATSVCRLTSRRLLRV